MSTRLACDKYLSYPILVQYLSQRCTTFELKMCYIWMKDVLVLLILLSGYLPHSAFSVSLANALTEGDSGWKHCFTTPSLTYFERGQVVSVLSALTYGLNFVSPELNFIHRRAKVCSPPRWKLASCRLISDQSSEECVLIKQRVCLPWIQALFILNTGSVWGKQTFCFLSELLVSLLIWSKPVSHQSYPRCWVPFASVLSDV